MCVYNRLLNVRMTDESGGGGTNNRYLFPIEEKKIKKNVAPNTSTHQLRFSNISSGELGCQLYQTMRLLVGNRILSATVLC